MTTPAYRESLDTLKHRIDEIRSLPPDQAARAWTTLAAQVDMLCKHIEKAEPSTAHATLPALGDVIRALDAVISELEN